MLALLIVVAVLGLYMAWNIGANDVANSMACAVGSKAISVKWALITAGICEFAGSVLVGSHVTDTIRKGIVSPDAVAAIPGVAPGDAAVLMILGMSAALFASALWLNFATWMGMPVSTTHAIVGAVAGFGVTVAGWGAVNWGKLLQIVASWFISPVIGGILGFCFFMAISKMILGRVRPCRDAIRFVPYTVVFVVFVVTLSIVYKGLIHISAKLSWLTGGNAFILAGALALAAGIASRIVIGKKLRGAELMPLPEQLHLVEKVFVPVVVFCSCTVAFSHGANDVANAIGPLAAVVDIVKTGTVKMQVAVPAWVLILGGSGIVLGLATYGYRVIDTVGTKITMLTPSRAVAAGIATTTTVLGCTKLGLPISTTHTLVGAVLGIGLARGMGAVNREVTKSIFSSWLITVPAAAILCVLLFLLSRIFLFDVIRQALP